MCARFMNAQPLESLLELMCYTNLAVDVEAAESNV